MPPTETGSATGFNQVLRTVGYSAGSALSATVLEAHTPVGAALPDVSGYTTAGVLGCAVFAGTALLSALLPRGGRGRALPVATAGESRAAA